MSQPPYLVPHSREEIAILYEDDHLLLVRKPHLLLTIPGRHPLNKDCLITRLRQSYPGASIVHRLDLDTSGIMVIPLNKPCHAQISRQFQERSVEKTYHAIVYGVVEQDCGEIDLPNPLNISPRDGEGVIYLARAMSSADIPTRFTLPGTHYSVGTPRRFTASLMSSAVTPKAAMRTGSSQIRIARNLPPNISALPTPSMVASSGCTDRTR